MTEAYLVVCKNCRMEASRNNNMERLPMKSGKEIKMDRKIFLVFGLLGVVALSGCVGQPSQANYNTTPAPNGLVNYTQTLTPQQILTQSFNNNLSHYIDCNRHIICFTETVAVPSCVYIPPLDVHIVIPECLGG